MIHVESEDEEEKRPELVGPELPLNRAVRFGPPGACYGRTLNESILARAETLFGSKRAIDSFYLEKHWHERPVQLPFELVPSAFLRRAQRMAPSAAEATASGFASWLYSLYSNEYGDQEDKERGREIEPEIFARRREMQGSVNDDFLRSIDSGWRLVHNGLHVPGQDHVPWFTIGSLRVNGEPLRASPDLIYHHARFNEVLIVEIKHSHMSIPSNLWPNVWGQLWCYSQLDIARTADRVTVIGEVWGERGLWLGRDRDYDDVLHMRASVRRNPRSPTFDRFFRALFDIYSSAPPPGQVD